VARTEESVVRYGDVLPVDFFGTVKPPFWIVKDLTVKGNPFVDVTIRGEDVVMDCGGCVGTFSAACLEQGASRAVVYEPVGKNFDALSDNLRRYGNRVETIAQALVPDKSRYVDMFLSGFSGAHSVAGKTGQRVVSVPAACFRDELLRVRPHVLKLDVEGAEYGLIRSLRRGDLSDINCVHIEFHPHEGRDSLIGMIAQYLAGEGLRTVRDRRRAFTARRFG
jgi:FkbM family methyltransferase